MINLYVCIFYDIILYFLQINKYYYFLFLYDFLLDKSRIIKYVML